jgi:hypothetical protein
MIVIVFIGDQCGSPEDLREQGYGINGSRPRKRHWTDAVVPQPRRRFPVKRRKPGNCGSRRLSPNAVPGAGAILTHARARAKAGPIIVVEAAEGSRVQSLPADAARMGGAGVLTGAARGHLYVCLRVTKPRYSLGIHAQPPA